MLRTVLTPLDGTPFGEQALPYAIAIARRSGATLHLVHVHEPSLVPAEIDVPAVPISSYGAPSLQQDREYLDALVRRLEPAQVPVTTALVEGPLVPTLEERIHACEAELVVMSTHARFGISELWHHNVAYHLQRETDCPLLLVRAGDEDQPDVEPVERPFRHLLIPLDGTPSAEVVLAQAGELCEMFEARCTLLHIIRPPIEVGYTLLGQDGHLNHSIIEREQTAAQEYLDRIAARLPLPAARISVQVLISDDAASAILDFTRDSRADDPVDLLAMEAQPRGRLSRLLGSHTAERVLAETPVPMLVQHPAAVAPAAARAESEEHAQRLEA